MHAISVIGYISYEVCDVMYYGSQYVLHKDIISL